MCRTFTFHIYIYSPLPSFILASIRNIHYLFVGMNVNMLQIIHTISLNLHQIEQIHVR